MKRYCNLIVDGSIRTLGGLGRHCFLVICSMNADFI